VIGGKLWRILRILSSKKQNKKDELVFFGLRNSTKD
jgi:hypothetical protein